MVNLTDCNIKQATSRVVFPYSFGKWYCAMFGKYKHVVRYLQPFGSWGKNTHWFDTKDEILNLLALAEQPDFTMSQQETDDLQMMEDDMARDLDEERLSCYDDLYDDPSMP